MHHLIYSSSATTPFSDDDLQQLLIQARASNEQRDVTGVLLYHDGQFMQLLEGEATVVHALYQAIAQDIRHTGVLKLADKASAARSFPDWAMAFVPVAADTFVQLQGYCHPDTLDTTPQGLSAADSMLLNLMRTLMLQDK